MLQVHVVEPAQRHLYEDELDQQFCIRADIFVEERRWSALKIADGRERDQFDTSSTIYVLAIDPEVGVVGGSRLHPSLEPTLLSDVFPQLAERGVERAPDVVEWTRLYCIKSRREERPCLTIGAIKAGILEYCQDAGIRSVTAVAETWYLPRFLRIGWKPRPLGLDYTHEDMSLFAFNTVVTDEAIAGTRAFYGLPDRTVLAEPRHPRRPRRERSIPAVIPRLGT